jgi:hypothetical protein
MWRSPTSFGRALGEIVLCAVVFAAVAGGSHSAHGQTLPLAPETLKPPAGEYLRAHAHASGEQIYLCDGSKWILNGPMPNSSMKQGKR